MGQANRAASPKSTGIAQNIVMNDEQVYCKTPDGESALVQRTRLVQRNLRNVLILVDGAATVADLTRKLGDGNFVRASLAELLRGGFVETIEENRVRRGLDLADAGEGAPGTDPPPALEDKPLSLPPQLETVSPAPAQDQPEIPVCEEAPPPPDSVAVTESAADFRRPPEKAPFWRRWFATRKSGRAATETSPTVVVPGDVASRPESKPVKVRIKPIRRGVASKPRWSWWARLVTTLAVLGACLVVASVVFPYDRYKSQVEDRCTAWLGRPVSIGEIRFTLMPRPGFALEQVRVGGDQGVVLGSVRGFPAPLSLFGDRWRIDTIVLERPVIDERAIRALLDPRKPHSSVGMAVQRVTIEGATVAIAGVGLEDVSGSIDLTPEAGIDEIRLLSKDGSVKLTAMPTAAPGLKLNLASAGWRAPWRGGIQIDAMDAEGRMDQVSLRIDKLTLRTLGGTITGSASVDWQRQVTLAAQGNYARINLQQLLALIEPAARAQGDLSGRIALRASGSSFESAARGISGGGPFSLDRGSLEGFDLVEAVRSRSDSPIRGGTTKLEEFDGSVAFDSGGWRLSGLRGNSGALSTSGFLRQAGGKVDGVMGVQLRGSANQVNVPVVITGSLADPLLTAKRRAGAPLAVESVPGADEGRGG